MDRRLAGALLAAAIACGPAERREDARCPVFTDLLVADDEFPAPWPANTYGDEAQEVWFLQFGDDVPSVGLARSASGAYEPTWAFDIPGVTGLFDYDLDGLGDPYVSPREQGEPWMYHPMGPAGVPNPVSIDLGVDPLESVRTWGDFDEDGLIDHVGELGGGMRLVLGAGTTISLDLGPLAPEAWAAPVMGDPRALQIGLRQGDDLTIQLVRLGDDGTLVPLWTSPTGPWRGSRGPWRVGDRLDFFMWRGVGDTGDPFDLEILRVDLPTGEVESEIVERDLGGMLLEDFDGDGFADISFFRGSRYLFRFGDEHGELAPAQNGPGGVNWNDAGHFQTHDLDRDGATELLLALETDEGRRQWRSLAFEMCE